MYKNMLTNQIPQLKHSAISSNLKPHLTMMNIANESPVESIEAPSIEAPAMKETSNRNSDPHMEKVKIGNYTTGGMAIPSCGAKALEHIEFELGTLRSDEIVVQVTHCGVCHTDLHVLNGDFGQVPTPLVLGHEIVGTVVWMGEQCFSKFKIGQRVGVGPNAGSCEACSACVDKLPTYCLTGAILSKTNNSN
jgi:hypothetical protein